MNKTLTQRFRDISEAPERIERLAEGVGLLIGLTMLLAAFALSISLVALERSSRGH